MVSNSTDIIKTNSQLSHQDVPLSTEVENSFQLKAKDRFTLILGYEISLALALSLSLSLSLELCTILRTLLWRRNVDQQ
jgi:hypothetical protein